MRWKKHLILPSLLLLAARDSRAGDDKECDVQEKERQKIGWFYNLPDRTSLPPLADVEKAGAFILLDEISQLSQGCAVTLIAEAGDKKAIDLLANFEVSAAFFTRAFIKGRVQYPDGKVVELQASDIHCQPVTQDGRGTRFRWEALARGYYATFANVTPGSVVQTQVVYACSLNSFIHPWNGSQGALTRSGSRGAALSRYPAVMLRYGREVDVDAKVMPRVFPEGAKYDFREVPLAARGRKLAQATFKRPALNDEPYSPVESEQAPLLYFDIDEPHDRDYDWDKLVKIWGGDILDKGDSSGSALDDFHASARVPEGTAGRALADRLNAYLRDHISDDDSYGRTPHQIMAKFHAASQLGKITTQLAILKAMGMNASPVLTRDFSVHPIDKTLPTLQWFNEFLVAVDLPEGRIFYDPYRRVPSGALPARIQGAEAIIIHEKKKWEWAALPLSLPGDNRTVAELQVKELAAAGASGTIRFTLTGSVAASYRDAVHSLSSEGQNSRARSTLDGVSTLGMTFSDIRVEHLADADVPVEISANFSAPGAVRKLGKKSLLNPLLVHLGPAPAEFVVEARMQEVSFRVPERYEISVTLPSGAAVKPALPEPLALKTAGLEYRREFTKSEDGSVSLKRTLVTQGVIPPGGYKDFRAFMQKITEADMVTLGME